MSHTYGYARVSSVDQNEERQTATLLKKGVPEKNIFVDKVSGKDFNRPQYKKMIRKLRRGDLLYVLSIDRLGRNYEEIGEQWRRLTRQIGADICVLDMPLLDTRPYKDVLGNFVADIVLQILSFVAHYERENIRIRQAQGIEQARKNGIRFGRPRKKKPDDFDLYIEAWTSKTMTRSQILKCCGVSERTFYRWLNSFLNGSGPEA